MMEYILVIWLCFAGTSISDPAPCARVTVERRYLADCRAVKQAVRDRAIDLAHDPDAPTITFRIAPCVRTGAA